VVVDVGLSGGHKIDFIIDDSPGVAEIFGVPVFNSQSSKAHLPEVFDFLVAIGDNSTRRRIFNELTSKGGRPRTLIHPSCVISPEARVLGGTVCCAGAIVNPGAAIGMNCIVNTGASVDHDCSIGDHSHVCPGVHLAGNVVVGPGTMIGTGTAVIPGVQIGRDCVVGAGSVVTSTVPDRTVAFGSPAKVRRQCP
jgi:sugar O-acyltransferase (sialic acid O-acetyltransferase NeuD family)